MKKKVWLKTTLLLFVLLSLMGCATQKKSAENTTENESKIEKGYRPESSISYPYYGSLPYIVGSADAVVKASIVKDQGIKTIKEGEEYYDYRFYTLKSEIPFKAGMGVGEEFQVKVDNYSIRKELTQEGFYFLSKAEGQDYYTLLSPEQGNLPIENGEILLTEETKVLFLESKEKVSVDTVVDSIRSIIH